MTKEGAAPVLPRRTRKAIPRNKLKDKGELRKTDLPLKRMRGTNLKPKTRIIPARAGTKQAILIDSLYHGATLRILRAQLSQDGKPWSDNSIRTGLSWDINFLKGYGIQTVFAMTPEELDAVGDKIGTKEMLKELKQTGSCTPVAIYSLVLPPGMEAPLPHTPRR